MPNSELYDKIRAEGAAQARRPRADRAGVAPSRVSNVPVRHAPLVAAADLRALTLAQIARHIAADWPTVNYAAVPYLRAMRELDTVDLRGSFHQDPVDMVVRYFLSNARTWKGENARLVKAELKRRLK